MVAVMTTPQASESQEAAFGRAVALWRTRRSLNQKQLADLLTNRGMKLDASAVSRIESGARSVRLTEAMLIAEVLDVELEAFTTFAQSPAQRLNRMRRLADIAMRELELPLQDWLDRLTAVRDFLTENPQLVANLPDSQGNVRPDTPDEYFDWVQSRIAKFSPASLKEEELKERVESGRFVLVENETALEELVSVAAEYVRAQLLTAETAIRLEESEEPKDD